MGGNAATVEKCVFPACRKITNTKRVDAVIRVQKRRGCGAPKSTTTSSWTTDEIESMKWIHGQTTYRERRRSGRTSGAADVSLPNPGFRLILFLTTTHSPSPSKQHKNRTILCKRFTFFVIFTVPRHSTSPPPHLLRPLLCRPEVSVHCRRRLLPITVVSQRPLRCPRQSRPQQGCRLPT